MSIKNQLLEAAKNIETAVELDSIFESVELSADVKAKFQTVFESAVKSQAVKLAETHIQDMAAKSDELVEAAATAQIKELTETLNKYLDHVAGQWMTENQKAVDSSMKAEMFESLHSALVAVAVEHNLILPEGGVDVVAEAQEQVDEARTELTKAIEEKAELQKQFNSFKRESVVESSISDLAESQKEKVKSLIEGIEYNELFESKLNAIVEMTASKVVVEAKEEKVEEAPTMVVEDGLNFKEEEVVVESKADTKMSAYLAALK